MRLRFSPAAEADIRDSYTWYRGRSRELAAAFRSSLDDCMERIGKNPLAYPRVHGEVRRALLRHFPYCVFYVVRESEVGVLGVFHGHRDPTTWQSRPVA
ncbi:MAG: type II toxin-antitoxin system RelE/ParE family toxin [Acidobacteria bacterium]|nr:type II toxin-antitoxin system RelE/ParE family toxin [Acidobacteriota bacterium]